MFSIAFTLLVSSSKTNTFLHRQSIFFFIVTFLLAGQLTWLVLSSIKSSWIVRALAIEEMRLFNVVRFFLYFSKHQTKKIIITPSVNDSPLIMSVNSILLSSNIMFSFVFMIFSLLFISNSLSYLLWYL